MSTLMEKLPAPTYALIAEPRVYRPSSGYRTGYMLIGCILTPVGLLSSWFFATQGGTFQGEYARLLLPAAALLFAVGGAATVAYALTHRLVLSADGIETVWLLNSERMPYEAIAGKVLHSRAGITTVELKSRRSGVESFEFRLDFKWDGVFERWFRSIPDLQGLKALPVSDIKRSPSRT